MGRSERGTQRTLRIYIYVCIMFSEDEKKTDRDDGCANMILCKKPEWIFFVCLFACLMGDGGGFR